jgi:CcmD family protein
MKHFIKYFLSALLVFVFSVCPAQNAEMADTFRSEGKIYVVVAIVLIILAGLLLYLFLLDKKLTKIEKQISEKQQTK